MSTTATNTNTSAPPVQGTSGTELRDVMNVSPTLRGLVKEQADALVRTVRIEQLDTNTILIREGAPAERMYLILAGDVDCFTGETLREVIFTSTRGSVIGNVFINEPSEVSYATIRQTVVASWDKVAFERAESSAPGLRHHLAVRLSKDRKLDELRELLQHASLFRSTGMGLRNRLLHEMTLLQFPEGHTIYRQGDLAPACFLIVDGEVEVHQKSEDGLRERVTRLDRGGVFGEAQLLTTGIREESVTTKSDVELLAIDRIDVRALHRACGAFRNALVARLGPSVVTTKVQDLILVANSTPHSAQALASLLTAAFSDTGDQNTAIVEVVPEGTDTSSSAAVLKIPADPDRALEVIDAFTQKSDRRHLILFSSIRNSIDWFSQPVWDTIIDHRISSVVYYTDDVRKPLPIETPQLSPVRYVEIQNSGRPKEKGATRTGSIPLYIEGGAGTEIRYGFLSAQNRASLQRLVRILSHQSVGVALGGGAAWGFAHVALLRGLHEAGIPVDMVSGTSVGSLVGCTYASRRLAGLDVMVQRGRELTSRLVMAPITRAPLETFLEKHCLEHHLLEDMPIPMLPVAVDLSSGRPRVFRHGRVARAASMSSAMPAFFVPELLDGVRFVDGGVANNVPVSPLVDEGADFIIASNVISAPNRMERQSYGSNFERLLKQVSPFGRARDALRSMFLLMHDAGARQATAAQITFAPSSLWKFDPFDFRTGPRIIEHVRPEMPEFIDRVKQRYRTFCQNRDR